MPSIQKIVLALAFAATTFAAQISDGQLQQVTTTSTPVAPAKQITDGQLQQVTSTPVAPVKQITDGQLQQVTTTSTPSAVVTPPVKQITDGQLQQVTTLASASRAVVASTNGTGITTPSAPAATFRGAASLMSYSSGLVVVAIGAAAAFAML